MKSMRKTIATAVVSVAVFVTCCASQRTTIPTIAEVEGPVKPLFRRPAPRNPLSAPDRNALIGKWVCRKQRNERTAMVGNRHSPMKVEASSVFLEFDLKDDGTCRVRTREESQYEIRGTWTYANGHLTIPCAEPNGGVVAFRVLWYGPGEMELRYENLEDYHRAIQAFMMNTFDPVCYYDADGCLNFSVKHRSTDNKGGTSILKYIKIDSPMVCKKSSSAQSAATVRPETRKSVAPFGRSRIIGKWEEAYSQDSVSYNLKGAFTRRSITLTGTFSFYPDGEVLYVTRIAGKETNWKGKWNYEGEVLKMIFQNQTSGKDENMNFKVIWYSDSEAELRHASIDDYVKTFMRFLSYADAYYADESSKLVTHMVVGGKDGTPASIVDTFATPRLIERTGDLDD